VSHSLLHESESYEQSVPENTDPCSEGPDPFGELLHPVSDCGCGDNENVILPRGKSVNEGEDLQSVELCGLDLRRFTQKHLELNVTEQQLTDEKWLRECEVVEGIRRDGRVIALRLTVMKDYKGAAGDSCEEREKGCHGSRSKYVVCGSTNN
jgi:hypothetical protein